MPPFAAKACVLFYFGAFFGVFAALCVFIIVFGAYGIGFDSNQFIYSQF